MCGRFTQTAPWEKVKKEFAAKTTESDLFKPRYNIAPAQIVPVVCDAESERTISTLKWGLVPSWSKDAEIGNRMVNARAETLTEKPSFREAFAKRRCLVPTSGFKVNAWSSREDVSARAQKLSTNYHKAALSRGATTQSNIPPKFILLHTLAHLLINQLSFDCGYGSSSLRERLYCDIEDDSFRMTGILIYTASGDSEGTMGGLVRQGGKGNLENIFVRALKNALWCSSDPICLESNGQGPGSCNFAACHGCALLPETACEKGNKLLDRVLLVGTPENRESGFFSDYLKDIGA